MEIKNINPAEVNIEKLNYWLEKGIEIASSITTKISASRKKGLYKPVQKDGL